ncbi:MAG: LCP family protein [Clostridia bacterium]|nr:LCP family protein [Clostridia bacterium]
MDDIYFSDKKRRNINNSQNDPNDFLETDYFDEDFDLNFKKGPGNAQSFISEGKKENDTGLLPEEFDELLEDAYSFKPTEYEPISEAPAAQMPPRTVQGLDRTPHGRPVSERYNGGSLQSRASAYYQQRPAQSGTNRAPSQPAPSRTPSGQRVAPPRGQRTNPSGASQRPVPHKNVTAAPKKRKKTSSAKTKILLSVFALLAVVVLALFGYGYSILGGLNYDDEINENRYLDSSAVSEASVKNILFIGSDARGDVSGQRSDTMILFSIDTKNRQIKLTSFLRDSYVYIPLLERKSKINASFSNGGAQATIDTVEYNFGVDIDNYVMVDFQSFEQIVDLLGGIEIDVTANEAKYMREDVKIPYIKEGVNKMNGKVALWYCRIRYLDNDFKRTQRQRKVISAIISKATKTSPVDLLNMVEEVVPNISTDLTRNELLSLGVNALMRYIRYDIVQQQIPADGTWYDSYVNGSYVIKLDEEENRQILKEFLLNKVEKAEEDKKKK